MKAILVHGALLALIVFIPAHQLLDPQVAAGVSLISALLLIVAAFYALSWATRRGI